MTETKLFLDGVRIERPKNWLDAELTVDWVNEKQVKLELSSLIFVGETAQKMIARANESTFVGSALDIHIGTSYIFHFNLDYSVGFEEVGCNECVVTVRELQGADDFEIKANGFSLAYLYDKGTVTDSDFVMVPYIINYIPDTMQLLTLSMSVFMLTKETIEVVKTIAETTSDVIEWITPNTASPLPSWSLGKLVGTILGAVVNTVYAIGLSVAIVKMLKEIAEQLLPKKRWHLGMKLTTMLERGCSEMELGFSSEQLAKYGDLVYIPPKGFKGGDPEDYDVEVGFPNVGDIGYLFGDLVNLFKGIFNSEPLLKDGVFNFERKDHYVNKGSYQLKNIYNDQDKLVHRKKRNSEDVSANYAISFSTDLQDQNTLDYQDRVFYQNRLELSGVVDKRFNNLKGGTDVSIPFSLARRKNGLNAIEKALKGLLEIGDALTGGSLANSLIKSRDGSMLLSSHFISGGRFVVMDGNELKTNQRDAINAQLLWNNEHYINSFAPVNGKHNQYLLVHDQPTDFCETDFNNLINSRYFPVKSGKFGRMDKFKWKMDAGTAIINYGENYLYEKNLTLRTIE